MCARYRRALAGFFWVIANPNREGSIFISQYWLKKSQKVLYKEPIGFNLSEGGSSKVLGSYGKFHL